MVFLSTEVPSPTDLQFFEVTDNKIVLTWTGPTGSISGYRVTALPVEEGHDSISMLITLPVTQNAHIEVTNLVPGKLHRFSVYTLQGREESLPLIGEQTTSEYDRCPQVFKEMTCTQTLIVDSFYREIN